MKEDDIGSQGPKRTVVFEKKKKKKKCVQTNKLA
jgi:hypothetical protein